MMRNRRRWPMPRRSPVRLRPHRCPRVAPGERGTATLLAAATMFLACVLCLVTVDLGRAVQARARAQTGADAAALAAAQEIAVPGGLDPAAVASDYAGRNGATLQWCQCQPGSTEAIVDVTVEVGFVLLGPDRTVEAQARATIGGT
jgi:secretion/DNA translocation related TadE-like protein